MRYSLFLCLLLFACTSTKDTTVDPPKDEDTSTCEQITFKSDLKDIQRDPFRMLSVGIEGDCLEVKVSYSGGCEGAKFELFYHTTVNKKPPPTVKAFLGFIDNDHCRSIKEETLTFNLKSAQQKGYDSVQILLGGWAQPINYSY